MSEATPKLAFTIAEAAEAVGVSVERMWRAVRQGEVDSFRWGLRGKRLITPEVIKKIIKRGGLPPEPPIPESGVYLMFLAGRLSYVGRSAELPRRLSAHQRRGRVFDEVRAIPCDPAAAEWLERELIRVLRPPGNVLRYRRQAAATEAALQVRGGGK